MDEDRKKDRSKNTDKEKEKRLKKSIEKEKKHNRGDIWTETKRQNSKWKNKHTMARSAEGKSAGVVASNGALFPETMKNNNDRGIC